MDLHITNGDGAGNIIKACGVPGDVLPWRDPMHHGPFPAELTLDQLATIRGEYLEGPIAQSGVPDVDPGRGFRLRDDHLKAAPTYDRVVLWFEHDLLDQLQILQILDWFADIDLGDTALEMICIDRFEGVDPFRGIGELDTKQMASLMDLREVVTPAQLQLAQEGWRVFRHSDPRALEEFILQDLSALPFLEASLRRHLEEYPCAVTGLTRTEHQLLQLAADGVTQPGQFFVKNMALESVYFIGDWPSYRHLGDLVNASQPLLESATDEPYWFPPLQRRGREEFAAQQLHLTATGEAVLAGQQDVFGNMARDYWLGGVHLRSGSPMWTWNATSGQLQLREA